ncbi:MAG: hypothetical protein ACRC62_18325 [Microcoleus sp.]
MICDRYIALNCKLLTINSQLFNLTSCTEVNMGDLRFISGGWQVYLTCLLLLNSLANPSTRIGASPAPTAYWWCNLGTPQTLIYQIT